jgi:hypothetical protein
MDLMALWRSSGILVVCGAFGCAAPTRDDASPFATTAPAGSEEGVASIDDGGDSGAADGGADEGGDDAPADDGGGDGPALDLGDNGGDDGTCACAPKSDLIYLLAWNELSDGSLWTFDPSTLEFDEVGPMPCNPGAMVFSMGISRDAKAYVQTQPGGDIFTYDVNSGDCGDPGFAPGQSGFSQFGMAFVSHSAENPCDELYALSMDGATPTECPNGSACGTLGVIDPPTMNLQVINGTTYDGGELSGTGDGRLFAFVGLSPAELVEFDKDTGEVIFVGALNGLELTDAFAFAFWGGDFYFFTETADTLPGWPEPPSKVVKLDYDGSDGGGVVLTTIVPSAPILVAGAGVSTCAPLEPVG